MSNMQHLATKIHTVFYLRLVTSLSAVVICRKR